MENIQKWLGHSNLTTTEQIYAHNDYNQKGDNLKAIEGPSDAKPNQGETKRTKPLRNRSGFLMS